MPSQEEVNRIIEQAKKNKGIDMSWLKPTQSPTQAQVQATGGIERISPGASQLMDAVRQAQAQTPVYMPFPGGTPTQQRRQAEEASRQFDIGQEFSREKFDWEKDLAERQFAADQAYRDAQLALSRLRAGGSGGNIDEMGLSGTAWYQRTIQNAIQAGESLENITKDIVSAVPEMTQQKVNPADMMRFALGQFEHQYGSQKYVPGMKTDIKWFQNYKWYLDNKDDILRQADVLERQYKPADPTGPVTGAEYLTPEERQRIAEILDIPAADVDLYIKTNPGLISQLLGKQYDW
jgi:hypothetical protein